MGSMGSESAKKKAMWLYPKVVGFNPSERWGHSACYYQGNVYIYGGCCGGLHFSDVLMLNLDTMVWKVIVTTGQGPGPRDSHSAVLIGNKMIVFGGTNGSKKVNDLHILDLTTKEWTQPEFQGTPPSPRESHTTTLVGDDKLVIFGGSGEGEANYLNDLHVLDIKTMTWSTSEVRGEIPVPRDSHSAVAVGYKFVVYGGDCGDRYHGDVDMLDMGSMTWSRFAVQGPSPGVRAGHAAVNIGTKIYILGGVGDRQYYNDAWVLDVTTCSWTQLNICGQQPQGRFSHTAVVADTDIVLYGGCGEDERPLNEMLVLQLGEDHPNGRYNISMCKIFGNHWSRGRRRSFKGEDNSLESGTKQSLRFLSETLHPKRRRTTNARIWEVESEQEEHSLSLSQHSSPSQSDQEQPPVQKMTDSVTSSRGFHFLTQLNQNPTSTNQERLLNFGRRANRGPTPDQMMGAEVRGRVDGSFDSGFLMTATVNGKVFRGVLFTQMLPRGAPVMPGPSNVEMLRHSVQQKPMAYPTPVDQSMQSLMQAQVSRPFPIIRASAVSPLTKEPKKNRSDLEGVFLTLGGPGSGSGL